MNSQALSITFAIIMVFSCFAGCIDTEEETVTETDDTTIDTTTNDETNDETDEPAAPVILGNVMASTYHVEQLVSAVGGELITVELISPSNVPVHDYEPSASDLIRLQKQNTDLFFYHGLNLEPWVDSTISSLGSDAPDAIQTHAMPSGEYALDYESMLVTELCELLSEGPYEATTLVDGDETFPELHAEHMAHKLSFPEEEHDGHGDEDDRENNLNKLGHSRAC